LSSTLAFARDGNPDSRLQPQPGTAARLKTLFVAGGLFVATFAIFSRTLAADFINYDDDAYVCRNAHVLSGLTIANARWAFTTFEAGNWHPLTWLSLQMDESMWGQGPHGFHFTNTLLHSVNAAILFLTLATLTGNPWQSAVAAGLFAWHPLRVESVAWVAERKDVLSTLFWLLAMAAYGSYARRPSRWRYLGALAAYTFGLLAKPMVITLPLVLLLLDYWPLGRWPDHTVGDQRGPGWLRLILEKVPFLVLLVGSASITLVAQANTVQTLEQFPLAARLANALLGYGSYLAKTVWPVGLMPFYPHPRQGVHMAAAAASLVGLIAITFAAWKSRRSKPYFIVGWLWFVGTLVPVIGLIQVGHQALADRYTYIPSIGIFIALTWGTADLAQGRAWAPWALKGLATAALGMCALTTLVQVGYWQDSITLWRHAKLVADKSDMAHFLLGAALERQLLSTAGTLRAQLAAEAAQEFVRAYTLNPRSADAHNNAGIIQRDRGDLNAAISEFRAAVAIDPHNGLAHYNLGQAYTALGQFPEAVSEYQSALSSDPTWSVAHNGLGQALAQLGQVEAARLAFQEALKHDPKNVQAGYNLGLAYGDLGRPEDAISAYRKVLSLEPDYAAALDKLGLIYLQKVKWQEAIDCFQRAATADAVLQSAREHLGRSLLLAGRPEDALPALLSAAQSEPPRACSAYDVAFAYHRLGKSTEADRWREKALALSASWPADARDLAWRYAASSDPGRRNGSLGLFLAREVVELASHPSAAELDALAAALAECGQFDEAVIICRRAIERAAALNQEQRQQLEARLELYRARQPFHEPALKSAGKQT
jgi:tetratricopeptide (TPR) repeat protein